MDFKKGIKHLTIFCLILLFLYWGKNAVGRYWSQPLSTDISYKYGDTNQGIQFPLITLCNSNIYIDDKIIQKCGDGSWIFTREILSCLKSNKTLNHMQNFHPEIRNIVETVNFWTGLGYVNLNNETVWTKVFHTIWGPCYTFDLSKVDRYKYILVKAGQRPGIEFVMAENNLWTSTALMLHTRLDLPDAHQLNGALAISFLNAIEKVHKVECRKKISKKESTRKEPCVKHEYSSCQSIEDNRIIFEKFHCNIPIIYSGHHLDDLPLKEAANCSYDVTLEALDFILSKKDSNCSMSQTCENVRFSSKYKVEETWYENKSVVYIIFESPEVEYFNTYISYDLISLIGEIGGILGITLGASALTLVDFIFDNFP